MARTTRGGDTPASRARRSAAVDREAIKAARQKQQEKKAGGILKFKNPGQYLVFVCPRQVGLPLPFVERRMHFGIGGDAKPAGRGAKSKGDENRGASALCLDGSTNDVLSDPDFVAFIENPKILRGGCARCEEVDEMRPGKAKKDASARSTYLFNMALIATREASDDQWKKVEKPRVQVADVPYTVWDGIMSKLLDEVGDSVCDPTGAQLLVVTRKGTGMNDTEYSVDIDPKSARTPYVFDDDFITKMDEGLEKGGEHDLLKFLAASVMSRSEMEEASAGRATARRRRDDDDEDDERPARRRARDEEDEDRPPECYKLDYEDDRKCKRCVWRGPCSVALKMDLFPGHELKEGDKGYVEEDEEQDDADSDPGDDGEGGADSEPDEVEEPEEETKPEPVAAKPAKPARATRKKPEPPPEPTPPPADDADADYDQLVALGYDEAQIVKMDEDAYNSVLDQSYPATATSILPDGSLKLFPEKLPKGHPEYVAPLAEPAEAPAKRRRRKPGSTPPAAPPASAKSDDDDDADDPDPEPEVSNGTVNESVKKLLSQLANQKKNRGNKGAAAPKGD